MQTGEELKTKFLSSLNFNSYSKYDPPFIIGFIGIVGSGKSTVAKHLAKELNILIASNDEIRRFFNQNNIYGESPLQDLLQEIAESRTQILLSNKTSHIIDADLMEHWQTAKSNASRYGSKFILIKIKCPEEIILSRIDPKNKGK